MLLTRSGWLKALATGVAATGFFVMYEVTIHDSKKKDPNAPLAPGDRFTISATAYCKGAVTAAGVAAQNGVAASDKTLLPLGSIVQLQTGDARYDGMYTILDTGPEIKGHEVDIYMWSCYDALDFGRKDIQVTLLRRGWDPRATPPPPLSLLDRLLGREPKAPPAIDVARPSPSRDKAHRAAGQATGDAGATDEAATESDAAPSGTPPPSSDVAEPALPDTGPTALPAPATAEPRPQTVPQTP